MRFLLFFFLIISFTSCSSLKKDSAKDSARLPAEETKSCIEMARSLFIENSDNNNDYDKNFAKALAERKLLSFTEKRIQIHYPHLDWINKVKKSFNASLRNWNNNRYPSFYISNDEETVSVAKKYVQNLEKILSNQVSIDDDETTKAYVGVSDWIKSYQDYKTDLDQLIEERISLQYNINLLKKLKLNSGNDGLDIQLTIKREGVLKNEIITLRKDEKNAEFTINKLNQEMLLLDGNLASNGKIKDRIIRQAMLSDMLNILHRELEHSIKNAINPNSEIQKEFDKLSLLIKNSDYSPSTYGVYKISNKVFIKELAEASKLETIYKKITKPWAHLKTISPDYFTNADTGTENEKIGLLKKIYLKITSISSKKIATASSMTVAGFGLERYFWFKKNKTAEEKDLQAPTNDLSPDDIAHQQQLEQTNKAETKKHDSHSSAVEIHINELTDP